MIRRTSSGFTLLELLVVILIIGLLTGIVAPRFLSQIARSETTTAKAQIDAFDKALQAYRIDMGRFPTEGEGLRATPDFHALDKTGAQGAKAGAKYFFGIRPVEAVDSEINSAIDARANIGADSSRPGIEPADNFHVR